MNNEPLCEPTLFVVTLRERDNSFGSVQNRSENKEPYGRVSGLLCGTAEPRTRQAKRAGGGEGVGGIGRAKVG